ncbi:MAG: family 2 glycosyl transferase [Sphingomonas bacterium]|nr:family 2 glycosyl transferase [Sphingomonas bacterium]
MPGPRRSLPELCAEAWRKFLIAARSASRCGRRRPRRRNAVEGDRARDRGDWGGAAAAYRRHLSTAADDFAIWVQLGHALKEAGTYDQALAAYLSAKRLGGHDADLWLSIGHLHTLRGDQPAAIAAYAESIRLHAAEDGQRRAPPGVELNYSYWLAQEIPGPAEYHQMAAIAAGFAFVPRFSFVVPTYDTPNSLLRACLDSLLAQTYPHFEICVADDASTDPLVASTLADYARRDARVKIVLRAENGHICAASNSALELATGDFIVLVDHDDIIPDHALFVVAHYLNRHPDAQILFSDEDKIDLRGTRSAPYFKGQFNRLLMYGHNMVSHLGVYRRSLVEQVGGFREGLEGSQDYDLFLRCYEQSGFAPPVHIPHILYHWRIAPGSTALSADEKSYAAQAAQQALNQHFARTGVRLRSIEGPGDGGSRLYPCGHFDMRASIIVVASGTDGNARACLDAILAMEDERIEVIVATDRTTDARVRAELAGWAGDGRLRIRSVPGGNVAERRNRAAADADGTVLGFIDDRFIMSATDWPDRVFALLTIPGIGAIGGRVLSSERKVEHFGLVLGQGEDGIAACQHRGLDAEDAGYFGRARLIQQFGALDGGCLFTTRAAFYQVGGFDPRLVAFDDVDFCLKLRARTFAVVGDPRIRMVDCSVPLADPPVDLSTSAAIAEAAEFLRSRWNRTAFQDPYFSPNLSLDGHVLAYAVPPRRAPPWSPLPPGYVSLEDCVAPSAR